MLTLDLHVTEAAGREVYMVALSIQLMIDPARRRYDDATRERLVELFGAPERWAVTTRSLVWSQLDVVVPAFTGSTTVSVPISCHYDLELAAAKYLHSLPDGEAPLALHFNGMIYYPDGNGRLQMVLIPWSKSIDFRMPVSVWRETIDALLPGHGVDRGRARETFECAPAREARARPGDPRRLRQRAARWATMTDQLEELVTSLLWEGYALYPYTPGATKNATPTPFGIVYPPVYAAECPGAFDHARLECVAEPAPATDLDRDAALPRPVRRAPRGRRAPRRARTGRPRRARDDELRRRTVHPALGGAVRRIGLRPLLRSQRNRGPVRAGPGRSARALAISTQLLVRISARAVPLAARRRAERASTPTRCSPPTADDVVLGTSYRLARSSADRAREPRRPVRLDRDRGGAAPSRAGPERRRASRDRAADPAVREMIARAAAATPEDIIALHGRVEIRDPETLEPPSEPPDLPDPAAGQPEAIVDGVRFARGVKVVIRPGPEADFHARMLEGRAATIERILTDYDGKTHLGVTIDDDPGRDLMRETGRLPVLLCPGGGGDRHMNEERLQSILVAGVGNAWLRDDGFGGEVARRLSERELPEGVEVMDAGTGGLDLAYEVMRGFDALVILDVSQQGGAPGTLYVMEADEESVPGAIEDGDVINPHAMDPQTVLRFVKSVGAWPGRVVVIACEPATSRKWAGAFPTRSGTPVERAVDLVFETIAELCQVGSVHELSLSSAIVNTVVKHADGRPVTVVYLRVGALRQVVPDTLEFYFEFVARGTVCEGARLEQELIAARLRCRGCGHEWAIEIPAFRCPECAGSDVEIAAGNEFEVESIEVEEAQCIAQR